MLKLKLANEALPVWVQSWAAYHPTADAHEQTLTVPVGVTGADVDGKYFTIWDAQDQTKYVGYFNSADTAETSTVVVTAEDANTTLAGKYFNFSSPTTDYYAWYSIGEKEKTTLTATAEDANTDLVSEYFEFFTLDADESDGGTETKWALWFNIGGSDPAPTPSDVAAENLIECDGVSDDDIIGTVAAAVRATLATAITAGCPIVETGSVNTIVIENLYYGVAQASTAGDCGFGLARTNTSVADSTDPEIGYRTGLKINVDAAAIDSAVGTATAAIINANSSFGATGTTTVTIVNAADGAAVDGAAGDSGFTFTKTVEGILDDATTQPPDIGGINVLITIEELDDNEEIAAKIETALDAIGGTPFAVTASTNTCPTVWQSNGESSGYGRGTSGFTIATTNQGSLGPLPGTSSGDLRRVVGKQQPDPTNPNNFTPFNKVVLLSEFIGVVESDIA